MRLTTVMGADQYLVWAHLESGDPRDQTESFIVGQGATKIEAWADAHRTLTRHSRALVQQITIAAKAAMKEK